MTVPYLISWYMFMETQMGNAMMPIVTEIASLMTMKSSIVRQPPIQIILFMKPERTDRPQNRAAITYPSKMRPSGTLSNIRLSL